MQLSDIPAKFPIPFANSAIAPYIRTIPQTPSGTPGQAALTTGFPAENFSPVAAGGVPPFGADFNGVINQMSAWNRWQATGRAFPPYDASFQTAVGGYPRGAIVESLVENMLFYISIVDNNVTNPDTGGAGWLVWSRKLNTLTANYDLYVNTATGNDSNNGLTPGTAKKTIQAAVTTAWTFPPSQYTITIHVADGTYTESVLTPSIPGPATVITGNVASPSNVVVNTSAGNSFTVTGPNTLTVKDLRATNSAVNSALFCATNGANMVTSNTVSGSVTSSGWVFLANGSGTVTVGSHNFNASAGHAFAAYRVGNLVLAGGVVFTVSANITMTGSAFALANSGGSIEVPATGTPTFNLGAFTVTGTRYFATLNGVINTQGQGATYFPGTVAGSTSQGGQYA